MANFYNPYQYGYQPQMQQQMPQQSPQQIQNNGFLSVRSEAEARNYPVAYGNSVTFKDENEPFIYVKTMGFSQLESPTFDKYRLVKEEAAEPEPTVNYEELKTEIENLRTAQAEIKESLQAEIATIKKSLPKPKEKKDE